jgi:hypothetical protein
MTKHQFKHFTYIRYIMVPPRLKGGFIKPLTSSLTMDIFVCKETHLSASLLKIIVSVLNIT